MVNTVYSDINVRLIDVDSSDITTIRDTKTIKQSLIRLMKTRVGEIPYFREYGLDLEQFIHAPLNEDTVQAVYDETTGKIKRYETRVNVLESYSTMRINYIVESIEADIVVQEKSTGEIIYLPTLTVVI